MKLDDFKELCTKRLEQCTTIMYGIKNQEYSRDDDKFHNFKRAANMLGVTPEQALLSMWSKHLVSVVDIVNDLAAGKLKPEQGVIDKKFNDSINYLLLLEGLITERHTCIMSADMFFQKSQKQKRG